MSTEIEQRVVEMRFDNKNFEKNVADTMTTLEKFKAKLNLSESAKSFEELEKAASKVDLAPLEKSASAVEVRFSAMSVAVMSAIDNIVNKAVDAGTKIVKSLTIDQVSSGFDKYEQKMLSVQTIMNATGKTIDQVTAELDKLVWFTDETSYSFSDMVNNVSKFTSNEIDLSVAIRSMMGIADAAGLAGASVNDASHAMDGFSKAIAQGYMSRQNWQWIRTAHMDTAEFKKQLIEAAIAQGTLIQTSDGVKTALKGTSVSVGDFETALHESWLTTDVMLKTLDEFGGYAEEVFNLCQKEGILASEAIEQLAGSFSEVGEKGFRASQEAKTFTDAINATMDAVSSGWMTTFEHIFGNYEEAKELWTDLANELWDIFAAGGEERNELLAGWKELGGREGLIKGITIAWTNLKSVVEAVAKAIRDVFPPTTAQNLRLLTNQFIRFAVSLKPSEEALYTMYVVAKTLLVPVAALWQLFKVGVKTAVQLASVLFQLADAFLAMWAKGNPVEDLFRNLFGDERYERIVAALASICANLADVILRIGNSIKSTVSKIKSSETVRTVFKKLYDVLKPLAETVLDAFIAGLEAIADADFSTFSNFVDSVLKNFGTNIKMANENVAKLIEGFKNLGIEFKALPFVDVITNLLKVVTDLKTLPNTIKSLFKFDTLFQSVKAQATGVADVVSTLAESFGKLLERLTPGKILVSAFGVAVTGTMLQVMELVQSVVKLTNSFAGIGTGVTDILKTLNTGLSNYFKRFKPSLLNQISLAIIAFAAAITVLSLVPADRLWEATKVIIALMGALTVVTAVLTALTKILKIGDDLGKVAAVFVTIAAAIAVLSGALFLLNKVDTDGLLVRLTAMGLIAAGLAAISVLLGKAAPEMSKGSIAMLSLAGSMIIMIKVLEKLGEAQFGRIAEKLGALVTVVGAMSILAVAMGRVKLTSALGLIGMTLSINLFVDELDKLAEKDLGSIIDSLPKIAVIIGLFAGLLLVTRLAGKNAKQAASAILYMSGAMAVISAAIYILGSIDPEVCKQGVEAVALIGLMFSAFQAMSGWTSENAAKISKPILAISVACLLLAAAMEYIGGLDPKVAAQGLMVVEIIIATFALLTASTGEVKGAATTMIAMTTAIGILSVALMLLTFIPWQESLSAATALSLVMLAFGGAVRLITGFDGKGIVKKIVILTAVTAGLTYLVWQISKLDPVGALANATALSMLMVAMSFMTNILSLDIYKDAQKALGSVILIGIILVELVGVLKLLSDIDIAGGNAIVQATALGILANLMASATLIFSKIQNEKFNGGALANMAIILVEMGVVMVALAGLFSLVNMSVFVDNAGYFIVALGEVALTIAAAGGLAVAMSKVAKHMEEAYKAVPGILVGLSGIGLVGAAMYAVMSNADMQVFVTNAEAWNSALVRVGLTMAAAGAVALVASKLGGVINFATIGSFMLGIAEVIGITGVIVGIAGGIMSIPGAQTVAERGVGFFEAIGDAIGGFIGHLLGSITLGMTDGLPKTSENIATFMENMIPFFTNVEALKDETLDKVGILIDCIRQFAAIDMATTRNITELDVLAASLNAFAPKFIEFANTMSVIDTTQMQAISSIVSSLAETFVMLNEAAVKGTMIAGGLTKFVDQLNEFAPAITDFAFSVSSITEDDVRGAIAAATIVNEFASTLQAHGGVLQKFTGERSLSAFAAELSDFGYGFQRFNDWMIRTGTIDQGKIESAVGAAKMVAGIAEALYAKGGALQWLAGEVDIGTFSAELRSFAIGFKSFNDYMNETGTIDQAKIESAVGAAKMVAGVAEVLQASDGVIQFWAGEKNLGKFGAALSTFGPAFAKMCVALSNPKIDTAKVIESLDAVIKLAEATDALEETGGLFDNLLAHKDWGAFGEELASLGDGLNKYYEKIKMVHLGQVQTSIERVQEILGLGDQLKDFDVTSFSKFSKAMEGVGTTGISKFIEVMSTAWPDIEVAINALFVSIETGINAHGVTLQASMRDLVIFMVKGIKDNISDASEAGKLMGKTAAHGVELSYDDMREAAGYIVEGFVVGMNANIGKAEKVSRSLARAVITSAENELGIASPSKVFDTIGEFTDEGFARGLMNGENEVLDVITDLMKAALDQADDTLEIGHDGKSKAMMITAEELITSFNDSINNNEGSTIKTMTEFSRTVLDTTHEYIAEEGPKLMYDGGRIIIMGIADGITEDTSLEEAVAKKVQNIASVFSAEMDKLDLAAGINDKQFSLWEKIYGSQASDKKYNEMQEENLQKSMDIQGERLNLAIQKWASLQEAFKQGEINDEQSVKEAYSAVLDEYGNLYDLAQQLIELRNGTMGSASEGYQFYIQWLQNKASEWKEFGATKEQIDSLARDAIKNAGYDPDMVFSYNANATELGANAALEMTNSFIEGIEGIELDFVIRAVTEDGVTKGVSGASGSISAAGAGIVDGIGGGILDTGGGAISNAITSLLTGDGVEDWRDQFSGSLAHVADMGLDGMLNSISGWGTKLYDAGTSAVGWFKDAIAGPDGLDEHSPSKVTTQYGEWAGEGLGIGIQNSQPFVVSSISDLITAVSNSITIDTSNISDSFVNGLIQGVQAREKDIGDGFVQVIDASLLYILALAPKFFEIGGTLGDNVIGGIVDSIADGKSQAINAVVELAKEMYEAACASLGIGAADSAIAQAVKGVADQNGAGSTGSHAKGKYTGYSAVTTFWRAIASDVEQAAQRGDINDAEFQEIKKQALQTRYTQTGVSPVLDLDTIKKGFSAIQAEVTTKEANTTSKEISQVKANNSGIGSNGESKSNGTTTVFNQNNYSPKALSRIDIYRQTNNLLNAATVKGGSSK